MSDTDTETGANVLIDFTHRVTLIRYIGNNMIPVRLKLRTEVFPMDTAEEIDFDVSFSKIKFWLETIVSHSVAFCRSNLTAVEMLLNDTGTPRIVNHLMICPYEPTDEHLAALLQSKMQALTGNSMNFGCVRIETEEAGLVFTYVGDWEVDLPSMEEWFAIKPYYFDVPWWQRDDASTLDVIAEGADVSQMPPWAFHLDFIENAYRPKQPQENVVIRGAFNPKVINGGRDDD